MAIVTGPLFSVSASGSVAEALVFFPWKGRSLVRKWLVPANPQTADQNTVRGRLGASAQAIQWMNGELDQKGGRADTDKVMHIAAAPAGTPWQSNVVAGMFGAEQSYWILDDAAWDALSAANRDAWDTAAEALTPPLADYTKFTMLYRAGHIWFHVQGANSRILGDTYPGAVPPTYS